MPQNVNLRGSIKQLTPERSWTHILMDIYAYIVDIYNIYVLFSLCLDSVMFYICVQRGKGSELHTLTFKSFQGISYSFIVLHNTEQSARRPLKACLSSLINFVAPKRPTTLVAHMPGYKRHRPRLPTSCPPRDIGH